MNNRITVPQVAKAIGVVMDRRTAWSVGSEMATRYQTEFGEQPPKDNRPKTNGHGSHCFALYPQTWEPIIRAAIEKHIEEADKQQGLWGDAP